MFDDKMVGIYVFSSVHSTPQKPFERSHLYQYSKRESLTNALAEALTPKPPPLPPGGHTSQYATPVLRQSTKRQSSNDLYSRPPLLVLIALRQAIRALTRAAAVSLGAIVQLQLEPRFLRRLRRRHARHRTRGRPVGALFVKVLPVGVIGRLLAELVQAGALRQTISTVSVDYNREERHSPRSDWHR